MLGFIRSRCPCGQQLLIVLGASNDTPEVGLAIRAASALGAQLVLPVDSREIVCPRCGVAVDRRRDPVVSLFEVLAPIDELLAPRRGPLN